MTTVRPSPLLMQPALEEMAADPALADSLPLETLSALYPLVARLEADLRGRLLTARAIAADPQPAQSEDHYLTIPEVAKLTGLSLSYCYELARLGDLPVRRMGRGNDGKKPRGYRVLQSELSAWAQSCGSSGLDIRVSNMLISSCDRRRGATASKTARTHAGAAREAARRAPNNGQPMGTRLADAESGRSVAPAADAD